MILPENARQWLKDEPKIIAYLEESLQKPSFKSDYVPRKMDILYDDILFISYRAGQVPYLRAMPENFVIPFTEIRFDDEIALFMIRGKILIDRTREMAQIDALLAFPRRTSSE